jgi:hypothetical protein
MTGTAYARIVDALRDLGGNVWERNGKARTRCPAHGSRGLSLIVSRRDDSAGVYCFAGCATDDVMAALGMTMRDLFDSERPPGYVFVPRPPPNPIGDPDHFCERIVQQEKLGNDPAYLRRRAAELEAAKPQPGDHPGGPAEWDRGTS